MASGPSSGLGFRASFGFRVYRFVGMSEKRVHVRAVPAAQTGELSPLNGQPQNFNVDAAVVPPPPQAAILVLALRVSEFRVFGFWSEGFEECRGLFYLVLRVLGFLDLQPCGLAPRSPALQVYGGAHKKEAFGLMA